MEVALREAMDAGRIEILFQPNVNLRTRRIVGFEASLQWTDPRQVGHGFGLTIAADGVEAVDQEASLLGSGCEEGQGEFFSAPVNAAQTVSLFASDTTASLRVEFRK